MQYFVDRIDFVGDAPECSFQDGGRIHSVRKGVAYILRGDDGKEYVAGPACAKRNTLHTNWGERVPDFTKGIARVAVEASRGGGHSRGGREEDDDEPLTQSEDDFAVSYLRLRMEKLLKMGFSGARYEPFVPYYDYWKTHGRLEESARRHIVNTEKKVRQGGGSFHMERLQKSYATAFLIDVALRHNLNNQSKDNLEECRSLLTRYYWLVDQKIDDLKIIFGQINDPIFKRFELSYFG